MSYIEPYVQTSFKIKRNHWEKTRKTTEIPELLQLHIVKVTKSIEKLLLIDVLCTFFNSQATFVVLSFLM